MCPELHSIQTYYAHSEGEGHAKHLEGVLKAQIKFFTSRGPGIHSDKGEHDVERDGLEGTIPF